MSFFYTNSAASARSRRTKDGQGPTRTSSTSNTRRLKDNSRSREERSPPPKSSPRNSIHGQQNLAPEQLPDPSSATNARRPKEVSLRSREEHSPPPNKSSAGTLRDSLYGLQNTALEHLPDTATSGKASPAATASPMLKASQSANRSSGVYHLPYQPHTPAALQKYLEEDNDKDDTNEGDEAQEDASMASSMRLSTASYSPTEFHMPGQFPSQAQPTDPQGAEPQDISSGSPTTRAEKDRPFSPPFTSPKYQAEETEQDLQVKGTTLPKLKEPGNVESNQQIIKEHSNSDSQSSKAQSMVERHDSSPLLPYLSRPRRQCNSSPPLPTIRGPHEQHHSIQLPPEKQRESAKVAPRLERAPSQDSKPGQSESVDTSPDATPLARDVQYFQIGSPQSLSRSGSIAEGDSASTHTGSPRPLLRSSSIARNPLPVHERSFTPPAPHSGTTISQSPPPYMSPIPVRAQLPSRHYASYSGSQNYPMYSPSIQHPEMVPLSHQQVPYYMDYHPPPIHRHQAIPYNAMRAPHVSDQGHAHLQHAQYGHGVSVDTENDTNLLLHRVQAVLPDFQLLLDKYREASGHLGANSAPNRHGEAEQVNEPKQKDLRIENLVREMEAAGQKHALECGELREQIWSLGNKNKELDNAVMHRTKSRDDLRNMIGLLQKENEELNHQIKEEEAVHLVWRDQESRKYNTKEKHLIDQLESKAKVENDLQEKLQSVSAGASREKEIMDARLAKQKQELENSHSQVQQEMQKTIDSLRQELESVRERESLGLHELKRELGIATKREALARDTWKQEREELNEAWAEERTRLENQTLKQTRSLAEQHQHEKGELQGLLEAALLKSSKANDLELENGRLRNELETLHTGWNSEKIKFNKATGELRSAAVKLNTENQNLQKMIEAFGEATDLRSRGDAYFVNAFEELHKQICQLATRHCKNAVEKELPDLLTRKIPFCLPPSFLADKASVRLQKWCVESIITQALSQRIFRPFLFTLGRRHETANGLFEDLSASLRQKSPHREAIWRQQTLHAAYTAPNAKQSVNRVAANIVDGIMNEIIHFTGQQERDQLLAAVRGIVKLAAETWRYARLEVDTISSTVDIEADTSDFDLSLSSDEQGEGKALLCLFPCFRKEGTLAKRSSSISTPAETLQAKLCSALILRRGKALHSNDPTLRSMCDKASAKDCHDKQGCLGASTIALIKSDGDGDDDSQASEDEDTPSEDDDDESDEDDRDSANGEAPESSFSPLVKSMDLTWRLDSPPLSSSEGLFAAKHGV